MKNQSFNPCKPASASKSKKKPEAAVIIHTGNKSNALNFA